MRRGSHNFNLQIIPGHLPEEALRETWHCAPIACVVFNSFWKIAYANHAVEEMFECIESDLIGNHIHLLISPSNHAEMDLLCNSFLEPYVTSDAIIKEVTLRKKDNTFFKGRITTQRRRINDEIFFLAFIENITDRVELKAELKLVTEKLVKVNSLMERFLYSSSHDLRSPLTSILGLVNLIRMDTTDWVMLDYTNKIEESALKLDKILKDIISFSKSTYQRVRSKRVDFNDMLWRGIRHYDRAPAFGSIKFEVVGDFTTPFFSDPGRLEIIFDNLIRNAITFMDPAKTFAFLTVNIQSNENEAIVEFTDNGIGIGKTHLSKIFNIFYKASDNSKGSGLGLYIVKEGLLQLNGSISVESEVGFGTSFRMVIPNNPKGRLISKKMNLINRP